MGGAKPKRDVEPQQTPKVVQPPVATGTNAPRRPLGHELTPQQKIEEEAKKPANELDPVIGLDAPAPVEDTPVEDEDDSDDFLAPEEEPFTWSVSKRDPRIAFVPITATRNKIARALDTSTEDFVVVGDMEAFPPSDDVEAIRWINGAHVPSAARSHTRSMRHIRGRERAPRRRRPRPSARKRSPHCAAMTSAPTTPRRQRPSTSSRRSTACSSTIATH